MALCSDRQDVHPAADPGACGQRDSPFRAEASFRIVWGRLMIRAKILLECGSKDRHHGERTSLRFHLDRVTSVQFSGLTPHGDRRGGQLALPGDNNPFHCR